MTETFNYVTTYFQNNMRTFKVLKIVMWKSLTIRQGAVKYYKF